MSIKQVNSPLWSLDDLPRLEERDELLLCHLDLLDLPLEVPSSCLISLQLLDACLDRAELLDRPFLLADSLPSLATLRSSSEDAASLVVRPIILGRSLLPFAEETGRRRESACPGTQAQPRGRT